MLIPFVGSWAIWDEASLLPPLEKARALLYRMWNNIGTLGDVGFLNST